MSIEEARLLAIQLLAVLDLPATATGPTVREVFDVYMNNHGERKESAARMRRLFERHFSQFADRPAASIKPVEVHAWHMHVGNNIGQPTANRALEVVRAAFNKAIKWGFYSGINPCMGVSVFPLESRDRYLSSRVEIEKFFRALGTMRTSTFRNFVLVALFTAARESNVMAMRWCDLDFDLKIWRIGKTKSGKPVYLPLIDEALAAIEGQRGKDEFWVFPGKGKTGHMVSPGRTWERLCKKAGISNLRMHDLRRTMGSWEANTGASLQVIQKTLGHSSTRATHIYARLQLEPVRAAMEKATKAMLS